VREGRAAPTGAFFLDIAWIKERIPHAAEHIKKKLPSMYHQFKQLADIDITQVPMEVGPTTHYMMGGIRSTPIRKCHRKYLGLFAAGECGAGLHGANRLGGNSLSDLLVFASGQATTQPKFAKDTRWEGECGRAQGGGETGARTVSSTMMRKGLSRFNTLCRK